jgi:hypothetical protein
MRDQRFTDLISGKPTRWERPLFFFTALFVADLFWLELGPNIHQSITTGYSISFFNVEDPLGWLLMINANAVLTILVFAAFRLVANELAAFAIVVILYPLLTFATRTLILFMMFGSLSFSRFSYVAYPLINSFGYVLFFVGTLVLALRLLKSVLVALLVGSAIGTFLSQLFFMGSSWLFVRESRSLVSGAVFTLFSLLSGVLFAVVFWLELRLTQASAQLPEPRLRKSAYAGAWVVAAGICAFLSVNTILLMTIGTWKMTSPRNALPVFLLLGVAMMLVLIAVVVFSMLIYKMWAAIQDGHARTDPGRAIGLLFVPFFNFYWAFQALWGFAKDYNGYIARHELNLRRLPEGLFLAYVILCFTTWIPFLGWILLAANLVVGAIMIAKICDAVNALPQAEAPAA